MVAVTETWHRLYENGLEHNYEDLLHEADMRAKALGLDKWGLWEFQYKDVLRGSLKQNLLLAYQMGLGKTAVSLALAKMYGSQHVLIVAPKRIFGEWVSEILRLGLFDEFQIIGSLYDARHLRRLNLVSLTDLWRIPSDSPKRKDLGQATYRLRERGDKVDKIFAVRHSLAYLLKKSFGTIVVDEAYSIKDISANQTRAITNLHSKHKILLTGTPIRGYPHNVLSLLNWGFGNGSDVWPEYSFFQEGAVQRFLERYGSYVWLDSEHRRTASRGKKKLLPKINDPEGFQEVLASKMIRRLNTEPEVRACVRIPEPTFYYEPIMLDKRHGTVYAKVLEDFVTWYRKEEDEARREYREIRQTQLLAKLTALIMCASFPQLSDDEWKLSGESTAKQKRAFEIVQNYVNEGRKVIVLSRSVHGARWFDTQLKKMDIETIYVDGSVSLTWDRKNWTSKRLLRLSAFRQSKRIQVLVGTTPCLAEGLNLPEASAVVFLDYDWVPSVMAQAFSRVLRPQQQRDVHVHFLTCKGTIEEYMELLCFCKSKSIAEGLDYESYDFSLEDLPDIRAYAQAIVYNQDILSRYSRTRKLVTDAEEEV